MTRKIRKIDTIKDLMGYSERKFKDLIGSEVSSFILAVGAEMGSEEIVELMLDNYEVDINAEFNEQTALHSAIARGQEKMVVFLIQRGANFTDCLGSERRCPPLSHAVYRANRSIIDILMKHGAYSHFQAVDTDPSGHPLAAAMTDGYVDIVQTFLNLECSIEVLRHAFNKACQFGHANLVDLLLDYSSDKGIEIINPGSLPNAAGSGHMGIVLLMLDSGANVNQTCEEGTPLTNAAFYGHTDVIRLLLEKGASINDHNGQCQALFSAMDTECLDAMVCLLKRGAGTEFKDSYGQTPLLRSADGQENGIEWVKLLLEYDADFNAEDDEGNCIMTIAVKNVDSEEEGMELAKYLVMHMVWRKCENLSVSDNNWRATSVNRELVKFQSDFKNEMKTLKTARFTDSQVSFYDLFKTKSDLELLAFVTNEEVMTEFKSINFVLRFPIFRQVMSQRFKKAIEEKRLLKQCEIFFGKLAKRREDKLPQLALTCIYRIASYLDVEDLENVSGILNNK